MPRPAFTRQFERDLDLMIRRGKDAEKFKATARKITEGVALEPRLRNHPLVGPFKGRWECHLEPDWPLVYKRDGEWVVFERTGTHADLFE